MWETARQASRAAEASIFQVEQAIAQSVVFEGACAARGPGLWSRIMEKNPDVLEILWLDSSGRVVASARRGEPILENQSSIPLSKWFLDASLGKGYRGSLRAVSGNDVDLVISLPAGDGEILAARISPSLFQQATDTAVLGNFGDVYIINRLGIIVAHSKSPQVYPKSSLRDLPVYESILAAPSHIWQGSYTNLHGEAMMGATYPVADTEWVVVVEMPVEAASAASRKAWTLFWGVGSLSAFIVLVLFQKGLQGILIEPIQELQRSVEIIDQGNLKRHNLLPRSVELGGLAEALNTLADKLSQRRQQLRAQAIALQKEVANRRKAVEELEQLSHELEKRIEERTAELVYQTTHDSLTGLYNRHYFEEEMRRLEASRQYPISIVMVDVDNLKYVNDTLGHPVGDEYLRQAANLLREVFRAEDIVARIGGDEFVILLPYTNESIAASIVDRIRKRVNEVAKMENLEYFSLSIGADTGYAGSPLIEVFKRADQKMYSEKSLKRRRGVG